MMTICVLIEKIPKAEQKDINPDVALKRVEQAHASLDKLKAFDVEENQNNGIKEIASTKEKDDLQETTVLTNKTVSL